MGAIINFYFRSIKTYLILKKKFDLLGFFFFYLNIFFIYHLYNFYHNDFS